MTALQDKSQNSSNLKIPALTFLRTALESTKPSMWQQHLPVLAPAVFATVGERYYKVTAQGLRVAEQLIYVIRPQPQAQMSGNAAVRFMSADTHACRTQCLFGLGCCLSAIRAVSAHCKEYVLWGIIGETSDAKHQNKLVPA